MTSLLQRSQSSLFTVKKQDTILLITGLILGIVLGFALVFFRRATANNASQDLDNKGILVSRSNLIGSPAPGFTLKDLKGNKFTLDDFQGEVVLLNFWATWCAPCRLEMPELQKIFADQQKELLVVGINFDEPKEVVQSYVEEVGVTFPILLDPGGEVQDLYRVRNYPTSFFVDSQGIIRIQHIGTLSDSQLDRYLRQMGVVK